MPYHDNEYKPDSPKKTTAKKEELIVPPNFISTPEQNIQQQLIKKIEAEARIKKPTVLSSKRSAFLNKGVKQRLGGGSSSCGPCSIVAASTTGFGFGLFIMSSPSATPIPLLFNGVQLNGSMYIQGWNVFLEVAKFGDKIWVVGRKPGEKAILEFTLSSNCSEITLDKVMPFNCPPYPNNVFNRLGGLAAKDSTTLLGVFEPSQGYDPLQEWRVVEIDVSGLNAIGTELFISPTALGSVGNGTGSLWDMVYLPDSNSIIGANSIGGTAGGYITWVDLSSGSIIDQQQYPYAPPTGLTGWLSAYSMFCYNGKIYTNNVVTSESLEIDLSTGSIILDIAKKLDKKYCFEIIGEGELKLELEVI